MLTNNPTLRLWLTLVLSLALLLPFANAQAFSSGPDELPADSVENITADNKDEAEKPLENLKPSIRQIRTAEENITKITTQALHPACL